MINSILGGFLLGANILSGFNAFPQKTAYTSLRVYGNNIVDNIHVKNRLLLDSELDNYPSIPTTPIWDGYTIMLATFNDGTLSGGNSGAISSPITSWDLFRRKTTEQTLKKLTTVNASVGSFVDNTAEPNQSYIYELFGYNATERTSPIVSDIVESKYYNWVLSSMDATKNYIFDLNLSSTGLNNEVASERYDGYSKYSQFTQGQRDFRTGTIQAIVVSQVTDTGLDQTVEFLETLRAFINDGEPKILKSRKGHIMKIVTPNGMSMSILNDAISQQPYEISIEFSEVGEI